MTRETKLKKYTRQLHSGNCDIAKLTNQYLEDTVNLLKRKLKRSNISKEEYESRLIEITNLRNEISDLQDKIKILREEINTLKDENRELRKENGELHCELNVLCNNFDLVQISEKKDNGELIQRKNQERINSNQRIRRILEAYKKKYESVNEDTIEAGPSKIAEIIDDEEMEVETKQTWKDLEIAEILVEIAVNLSPKDLFLSFSIVDKMIFNTIKCHTENNQNFWRTRRELGENLIPEMALAIDSVDFCQLQWYYLHPSLRNRPDASHILFFLRKDVDRTLKQYDQVPDDVKLEWLEVKSKSIQEFQKEVLKYKHPIITDQNIESILLRSRFYIPICYSLQDNLNSIH
ncbi:21079_t:CDS:2 [Dentiscutata erythropus]|uniref:21079_t:CDS:1 n=1 Tax=Dentiscutata erythropus TaxID=1348616 RepID=A0A9N9EFJ5_9GLOM|nr:21079_t:CDS:2 [Dentiscutata erythropus]